MHTVARMHAVAFTDFGPPDVLRAVDLPVPRIDPVADPTAVRVAVRAAGVMPFDTGVRAGEFPRSLTPGLPEHPVVPGNEFAGVVDATGPDSGFAVGDEVFGFTTLGAYAQYVVVPSAGLARKPAAMPWTVAAALPGNGQGAHMALRELEVGPGDIVLIHAAAGGLGTLAVQIARAWGAAAVIGTAGEANHDYLRELGAIPVRYGPGLVERIRAAAPDGVDAVLDGAGREALLASVDLVRDRDRIVTMIDDATARELGLREWTPSRDARRLVDLTDLWSRGELRVHFRAVLPLLDAADAHRLVERGHGRGKVVLTVDAS
jgi:NADPH:quinone reductase-like Zn-dependent oxidoreductase